MPTRAAYGSRSRATGPTELGRGCSRRPASSRRRATENRCLHRGSGAGLGRAVRARSRTAANTLDAGRPSGRRSRRPHPCRPDGAGRFQVLRQAPFRTDCGRERLDSDSAALLITVAAAATQSRRRERCTASGGVAIHSLSAPFLGAASDRSTSGRSSTSTETISPSTTSTLSVPRLASS